MDTQIPNLGSLKCLCVLHGPGAWKAEGRASGSNPVITICYLPECCARGRGVVYVFCTIICSSPQSLVNISAKSDSSDDSYLNPLSLCFQGILPWLSYSPFPASALCTSIHPPCPLSYWYSSGIPLDQFLTHTPPRAVSYIATASSTFTLSTPTSVT